ncbi:hypothetical protein LINPERHAP2_LOCUS33840 [Linum perenne]
MAENDDSEINSPHADSIPPNPFTDHYSNPLFLSPGENLSTPIITIKLGNNNYHLWSRSLSVALRIKNKVPFIDGTFPPPAVTDKDYAAWNRCNYAVLSWILNSVSEDIAQSLISYDNAATAQYFTNLKMLWEEYLQYRPIPSCDFSPGRVDLCAVAKQVSLYQEQDYSIRFIRSLNDRFDMVRSQLLLMDPLPDILTAFKCAVQLERQMGGMMPTRSMESMAMATNFQARQRSTAVTAKTLFCRYCKKDNHMIDDCIRLKNKRAMESVASSSTASSSPIFTGLAAGAITHPIHPTESERASTGGQSAAVNISLSSDELSRLRLLLQQAESVFPSTTSPDQPSSSHPGIFTLSSFSSDVLCHSWIIDTGASDHITCSLDHFSSYEPINPLSVTLPTGHSVQATHIGTIFLSNKIVLHRVLYIPQFSFNLLSVSRLTSDFPVSFIFSGSQCLIQD